MKKTYKFGEMLLYLREEYKEYVYLLNDLKKCIQVTDNKNFYFTGSLGEEENKIRLIVKREYSKILKCLEWLKYDWYSEFLYTAHFNVIKNMDNTYSLEKDNELTPIKDNKRYLPLVNILYQDEFNNLINELLSRDIMKIKSKGIHINYDFISLDFDYVLISSKLGYESLLSWEGNNDSINYSVKKGYSPYLLERILYLEVPRESIPPEWLQIFERHENKFSDEIFFDVDINTSKKGNLIIDSSNNRNIKLLRKK